MTITLQPPKVTDLRPRITVIGVGGAGGNAVNNMIASGLTGVDFVVANTDAQALADSSAEHRLQLGTSLTEGLGAGSRPEIGRAAAEEAIDDIRAQVSGAHMVFIAAGMGGGTGTGAAAVIARIARESGALTVGVVTKPFQFEGSRRMRVAEQGVAEIRGHVDTLIVIPNQNLFRIANEKTTFSDAFVLADQVLYSGVACIVDLIVKPGLINLDFADVRTIMSGMGTAMMGTGEAAGERRAVAAAADAISNPLLDDISLGGARGLLISITGSRNLTLYEVDEAATRVRQEVDPEANVIVGATFDDTLGDRVRVSIVASGMERLAAGTATGSSHRQMPSKQPSLAVAVAASATQVGAGGATRLAPPAAQAPHRSSPASPAHPVTPAAAPWPTLPPPYQGSPLPPAGEDADDEIARALSAAISAAAAMGPAGGEGARDMWEAPSGGRFEEVPPRLPHAPASAAATVGQHQLDEDAAADDQFRPQSPSEIKRSARRSARERDGFPLADPREPHARPDADDGATPPPRAYSQPVPPPQRRLGFFERLTGARRRDTASAGPSAGTHPQGQPGRDRHLEGSARDRASGADSRARQTSNEDAELPVFFGQERKS